MQSYRYYSDQRFKVVTVYMITSGLLLNIIKDHPSMLLAATGMLLTYFCFSWELVTSRWWGTLIEHAKSIEKIGREHNKLLPVYLDYTNQNPKRGIQRFPYVKPSHAVSGIYALGFIGWVLFFIKSWGTSWG